MTSWMLSTPLRTSGPCAFCPRPEAHRLLCALNQRLQTAGDLAALLESITAAARWALNPHGCVIWLRPDAPEQPAVWIGARPPACLLEHQVEPGQVNAAPVVGLKDALLRRALLEAGMSLVAPLVNQGEIIGWLGVGPPQQEPTYSPEKQCFLEILAGQAALAVQNLRLKTRLESSIGLLRRAYQQSIQAQENERRQLAEALHDETLQHLADISVRLGLLRSRGEIGPADLEDVQTRLARADRCLRELVRGVHPAVLTDLGLIEAIIAFLETVPFNPCSAPVQVELRVRGFNEQRLLDQNLELALYRFVQNGTSNALAHARPGRIGVELSWGLHMVEVQISDDGCGMYNSVEEASRAGHFGLLSMRARIEALGGVFSAASGPGRGTKVRGCVPVTTPSPKPERVELYRFDLA